MSVRLCKFPLTHVPHVLVDPQAVEEPLVNSGARWTPAGAIGPTHATSLIPGKQLLPKSTFSRYTATRSRTRSGPLNSVSVAFQTTRVHQRVVPGLRLRSAPQRHRGIQTTLTAARTHTPWSPVTREATVYTRTWTETPTPPSMSSSPCRIETKALPFIRLFSPKSLSLPLLHLRLAIEPSPSCFPSSTSASAPFRPPTPHLAIAKF